MKTLQVLTVIFILTAGASVYAMGVNLLPFTQAPRPSIEAANVFQTPAKASYAEKKMQGLLDRRHFDRLLAASS